MKFKLFDNSPPVYGMSNKADGDMHGFFAKNIATTEAFFKKISIVYNHVVFAELEHSNNIAIIESAIVHNIPHSDGLISCISDLVLALTVADCFPVYFFDPVKRVVGLAHSGWRGTVKNISGDMIRLFVSRFRSNPSDIRVGIGPGICANHFEIKEDILSQFAGYAEAIIYKDSNIYINLPAIIIRQLEEAGIQPELIENCLECTFEDNSQYFSFRRDKPAHVQAMTAYISL